MFSFFQPFKTLILAIILSIGISYAYAAWAPPTAAPTGGNAEAAVNVGSATQVKAGGLGVSGLFTAFSGIKIGNSTVGCNSSSDVGVIKNTGTDLEGCVGSSGSYSWKSLTAIGGGGGGPTLPPTVDITASDTQIPVDYSTTLNWTSTDATSGCVASGSWSVSRPASDSETVTPGSGIKTYTITCSNPIGSATDSVTVDVRPWQTVSGYGGIGQTCNQWLTNSGQRGIDNSPPRVYNSITGTISNNACAYDETYRSADDGYVFGASCWQVSPDTTGGITPIGECGYNNQLKTQTRR